MDGPDDKNLSIRNSTAEFLIFTAAAGKDSIEVRYMDDNIWLTQKMMATLYGVTVPTINEHIKNIFASDEQDKKATIRKFRIVQTEGSRQVERTPDHYCLELVIAVGYRVNSTRATQFRKWATGVIKTYSIQGYVLDKKRLENGNYLGKDYFEKLLHEIREIRLSERRFYQKITDIYATALDYDKTATTTKQFFATVQNKLHYAIHGETAAELIQNRANAKKQHMGLQTWDDAPDGKIQKYDVSVAKNYLNQKELTALERIVTMYLEHAEYQAERNIPMTMEDWANRLNIFLDMNQHEVLDNPGKVSTEIAKEFAESEFEKYRIVQDALFVSDFDRMVEQVEEDE